MGSKTIRNLALVASAALLVGAFVAAPASAKKAKKCPKYTAPDWAADVETATVTDAATESDPLTYDLTTGPGAGTTSTDYPEDGDGTLAHSFQNIVVDSKASTARVFARIDYIPSFDYDLFVRIPSGPAVAYEADFNPFTAAGPTPVGGYSDGSAGPGWSQIDGFTTADCGGYTVDVASSITPGGPVTLKIWLGK
ncbi:MAG: hypothetical protein QOG04_1589 [Actinomycetota bacterium]|jgi:hypothetical protein|nr:hypothetical protein [Actinomycetota bacterium]